MITHTRCFAIKSCGRRQYVITVGQHDHIDQMREFWCARNRHNLTGRWTNLKLSNFGICFVSSANIFVFFFIQIGSIY